VAFRRTTGIKAYVGARSMTATLLALVISLFAAAAASAHGTRTQRNAHTALSALVARGVVLRPGVGYRQGGSRQVRELQRVLSVTGYPTGPIDGRYGPLTTHAVLGYQSDFGLRTDGIAGQATLASLNGHGELLRRGAGYELGGSPIVRHLQLLLAKAGDSPGPFDGRFGPRTEAAVRRFQAHDGLRVTGIVGPRELRDLRAHATSKRVVGGKHAGSTRHSNGGRSTSTVSAPAATPAPTASTPTSSTPATPPAAHTAARTHGAGHSASSIGIGWILGLIVLAAGLGVGLLRYLRRRRDDGPMAPRHVDPVAPVQPEAATVVDNAPGDGVAIAKDTHRSADVTAANAGGRDENGQAERPEITGDITPAAIDINGAFNLGVLLEGSEDLAGARAAYRRADERGHAAAASNLGVLLEGSGDRAGAEAAYRRADERGEANGAFNLGVLLEEKHDLAGAETAYHRAERSADARVAQLAGAAIRDLVAGVAPSGAGRDGGAKDGT
jgi:peptidoglycan hydrolase-like protein with peptidoglycan-binding domain